MVVPSVPIKAPVVITSICVVSSGTGDVIYVASTVDNHVSVDAYGFVAKLYIVVDCGTIDVTSIFGLTDVVVTPVFELTDVVVTLVFGVYRCCCDISL
jgi:hypothetical protein